MPRGSFIELNRICHAAKVVWHISIAAFQNIRFRQAGFCRARFLRKQMNAARLAIHTKRQAMSNLQRISPIFVF